MPETQQSTLITRVREGDREAFRELVELHHAALFGTAYLILRDRDLAKDIVQEALIKIWRHFPSLRRQTSVKAWMVRIVVNETKQYLRKKKLPVVSLEMEALADHESDDSETNVIHHEEMLTVRHAMKDLSREQREVVVLRYFSELTIPEIATVTNNREGTVKSRLSRAMDRLNKLLRDSGTRTRR